MSHHSISFDDNSDSYNLYDPDNTVKSLLDLFLITFGPERKVQIKCTFSMPNYQPQPEEGFVKVTGIRICSTDGYTCVYFMILRSKLLKEILEDELLWMVKQVAVGVLKDSTILKFTYLLTNWKPIGSMEFIVNMLK